eukprot:12016633-Heterocapsa_arctica.AAC.1
MRRVLDARRPFGEDYNATPLGCHFDGEKLTVGPKPENCGPFVLLSFGLALPPTSLGEKWKSSL